MEFSPTHLKTPPPPQNVDYVFFLTIVLSFFSKGHPKHKSQGKVQIMVICSTLHIFHGSIYTNKRETIRQ